MVHPPILQHHAMALYEMGETAVDFIGETTGAKGLFKGEWAYRFGENAYDYMMEATESAAYAIYAFISLVFMGLAYMATRYVQAAKGKAPGIEAFAYEEDPLAEKKGADVERVD